MAQDTPSRKLDQYIVRFPDGMRDRLKAEAETNKRSLNAEIVRRIERTLAWDKYHLEQGDYFENLRAAAGDDYAGDMQLDMDVEAAFHLETAPPAPKSMDEYGAPPQPVPAHTINELVALMRDLSEQVSALAEKSRK